MILRDLRFTYLRRPRGFRSSDCRDGHRTEEMRRGRRRWPGLYVEGQWLIEGLKDFVQYGFGRLRHADTFVDHTMWPEAKCYVIGSSMVIKRSSDRRARVFQVKRLGQC